MAHPIKASQVILQPVEPPLGPQVSLDILDKAVYDLAKERKQYGIILKRGWTSV